MKTLIILDEVNGTPRDVQLGESLFAHAGVAARRPEAGVVITRCREAVRLRFDDGEALLAFAVSHMPRAAIEATIAALIDHLDATDADPDLEPEEDSGPDDIGEREGETFMELAA